LPFTIYDMFDISSCFRCFAKMWRGFLVLVLACQQRCSRRELVWNASWQVCSISWSVVFRWQKCGCVYVLRSVTVDVVIHMVVILWHLLLYCYLTWMMM